MASTTPDIHPLLNQIIKKNFVAFIFLQRKEKKENIKLFIWSKSHNENVLEINW